MHILLVVTVKPPWELPKTSDSLIIMINMLTSTYNHSWCLHSIPTWHKDKASLYYIHSTVKACVSVCVYIYVCVCNLTIWETASVSVCSWWNTTMFCMYIFSLPGSCSPLCSPPTHPSCISPLVETCFMLRCVLLPIFLSLYLFLFLCLCLIPPFLSLLILHPLWLTDHLWSLEDSFKLLWMLLWDFIQFPSKQNPQNIFYRIMSSKWTNLSLQGHTSEAGCRKSSKQKERAREGERENTWCVWEREEEAFN